MTSRVYSHRVLVMGYRQGLCDALTRIDVPYAVWAEKDLKSPRTLLHLHVEKFPRTRQRIEEILSEFPDVGHFTHVIAGTEAAVYPASVARRIVSARLSKNSVALRCHDKLHMKSYLRERKIPMTDFVAGEDIQDAAEVIRHLGVPVVVKTRDESGGRGIEIVKTPDEIAKFARRNRIMERFVSAPEASVESFINGGEILFTNITQYYVKKHINIVPGMLNSNQQAALLELNRQVVKALKIKWGITHMEAYLSENGILFGEIALRPPGGYIMELISQSYGFSSWDALVHVELDLPFEFPDAHSQFSAVYVIHPGAGTVCEVHEWDTVSHLPSVYKSKLKVESGSVMAERQGVGEDAGYLMLSDPKQENLLNDIERVCTTLKFIMK